MGDFLNRQKIVFFAVAICSANLSFSQLNFKKGYVVTASGDTLSGLVEHREGFRAYKICAFKALSSQNVVSYEPGDIRGYGFNDGRAFQTRKIKDLDGNYLDVFLDVKVVGLVNLYRYERWFFVQKQGDSLRRLSNDKSEKLMGEKLVVRYTNQHIAVLSTLLFDCVELRDRTQKVPFEERQVTTLIEDYNRCQGATQVTLNASKPWVKLMVGVTGGLHLSKLEVQSHTTTYDHLEGSYDVTRNPFFGLSFDVLSPRLSERLSFHGGLLYLRPTYRLDNKIRYSLNTHFNHIEIETNQVKIPVGFRYSFLGERVIPYVNVGISTTFNFGSKSTWDQKINWTTKVESNHNTDVWDIRTNQMGFWGGFGIAVSINKKIATTLEIRYEQTQSFSDYNFVVSGVFTEVKNLQFVLGIRRK